MSTKTPNYELVKPELTDVADITAMNENWDKIDKLLAESIEIDDWDNARINGYYRSNVNAPDAFEWFGHVVASSNDLLVQTVYRNNDGLINRCVRRCLGGSFGEWEWDNPCLSGYAEYRTTERINGKAVYKRNSSNGYIEYRLDGETTWKPYTEALGGVKKSGDTVNGDITVYGALSVKRTEHERHARTVVHNNEQQEIDFQNYGNDSDYVALRLSTEERGAGDAAHLVHMKDGTFAAYTLLHTGNKGKIFTYGTTDLTAGSSSLETGKLYFVYE